MSNIIMSNVRLKTKRFYIWSDNGFTSEQKLKLTWSFPDFPALLNYIYVTEKDVILWMQHFPKKTIIEENHI